MPKRGNNEGNIRKRPDGRYEARITLPDGRRKSFYADTRQEVAQRLAAAMRDRDRGMPVVDERMTLAHFLDRWLETSVKPSVRPGTYDSYEGHVRIHLKPSLGKVPLAKLSPDHVQAFINRKIEEGLTPSTALRIRATLRRALNQAMRWGVLARNVSTLIDPPQAKRPKVNPMTPEQAKQFIAAVQGDRLEGLYNLVLATGLRQGEALGLKWEDVDLDQGRLTVRHAMQKIRGERVLVRPKTESSIRTLPIPVFVVNKLREHRARQNRERLLAGDRWQDSGFVFTTGVGRPMEGTDVTQRFQKIIARAGLPHQRFHDLRHAAATFLLSQGVDLQVVKTILGHSSIALTADTYAHVMPPLQQDAMAKMDVLFGNGG